MPLKSIPSGTTRLASRAPLSLQPLEKTCSGVNCLFSGDYVDNAPPHPHLSLTTDRCVSRNNLPRAQLQDSPWGTAIPKDGFQGGHPVPSATSQPPPRCMSVFKTRARGSQHHLPHGVFPVARRGEMGRETGVWGSAAPQTSSRPAR